MAKLTGAIKLQGTIDDLTFVKTKDGYQARRKSMLTGDTVRNSPQFERTRENMAEFTTAVNGGKVLRHSLRSLVKVAKDRKVVGRVMAQMMMALKTDVSNLRGQRTITGGNLAVLERLEFNIQAPLAQTLKVQFTGSIDRVTGIAQVQLQGLTPLSDITAPTGTTHFQIMTAITAINFEEGTYEFNQRDSAILPCTAVSIPPVTLSPTIAANSTQPLFLALGVQFFQEFGGHFYPLKDTSTNALAIIKVDAP